MPKTIKHQTHGKVDDEKRQPTTLEQVWGGFNEMARYGTLDEQEYEQQLKEMNLTDLHAHARKLGFVPVDSVERLRGNLMREFRSYAAYLSKPVPDKKTKPKNPSKEIDKILAEGR
jgi:hypothetical protein